LRLFTVFRGINGSPVRNHSFFLPNGFHNGLSVRYLPSSLRRHPPVHPPVHPPLARTFAFLYASFIELFHRENIGCRSGARETTRLVYRAIAGLSIRLDCIEMFHTDRGSEFDNPLISEALETFGIRR
jgi:transposase InsO family protein